MIILLNLIPFFILATGIGVAVWRKKAWVVIPTILALFIYYKLQPSYLPKGNIERTALPEFNYSGGEIQDRSPKAKSLDDSRSKREEVYKNGLPF